MTQIKYLKVVKLIQLAIYKTLERPIMNEKQLTSYVKQNGYKLFGEAFDFEEKFRIDGQEIDLKCTDAEGRTVLVEVKADTKQPSDTLHEVVGQLLNYAVKYMKLKKSVDLKDHAKHLRLFIVQEQPKEEYKKALLDVLDFLRVHGIDIKPIFVDDTYLQGIK